MHKRAFQVLKRTFMHVSGLHPACFDFKNFYKIFSFFNHNKVGEDLRLAQTCVSGPETHVFACLRFCPTIF